MDIYDRKTRIVQAELNFLTYYKRRTILKSTEKGALRYKIYLNGLTAMWKAYRLYLTPHKCTNDQHLAYAVFKSPWNHDSSHAVIRLVLGFYTRAERSEYIIYVRETIELSDNRMFFSYFTSQLGRTGTIEIDFINNTSVLYV